ncbi:MAG TPA: hypothetical protein QGG70_02960 [Candidatus Pacearchaeota archaeon]|jgi:hypothetical protein|nr:hypothetical protein [Candidatus Pacearchaeota archaeon]|tara:strand:+ start:1204 stop:1836 length:633 start_codon:yes stop_codon:yes gene_type:complete
MKYLIILFILINVSLVSAEISYELDWDEEDIINGDEFKVKVIISGEEGLYDGKLWIEDNDKIISDRYNDGKWKSSYYYIKENFEVGKNKVKLRIDEKYDDFEGDAYIHFKIRGGEEIEESIEILKKKVDDSKYEESVEIEESEPIEEINEEIILEPISLGKKVDSLEEKDINTENIVYESKGLKIIEYSVYGFTILCVLLCVLIMWRKLE